VVPALWVFAILATADLIRVLGSRTIPHSRDQREAIFALHLSLRSEERALRP
jgi:hypothetical protein